MCVIFGSVLTSGFLDLFISSPPVAISTLVTFSLNQRIEQLSEWNVVFVKWQGGKIRSIWPANRKLNPCFITCVETSAHA